MCSDPSLPPRDLLWEQAAWLAPARSRLLRRAGIATRRCVLDLACGPAVVTDELASRCAAGGVVVALDRNREALTHFVPGCASNGWQTATRLPPIQADACHLPFPNATFDFVFCQFGLMWVDAPRAVAELARVLETGGVAVALEPDFGGLMEYPPETAARSLWLAGLKRAGATADLGRRLPGLFDQVGFRVHVGLLDRLPTPSPSRFAFLRGLPLTPDELLRLDVIERRAMECNGASLVAHLPVWLLTAERH